MTSPQSHSPAIERSYVHPDEQIAEELTSEQRGGAEEVLLVATLTSRHQIDTRKSFPSFSERYYLVFLFSKDLHHQHRQESTLSKMLLTSLLLITVLFVTCYILLTLYMIGPTLGTGVSQSFHMDTWSQWLGLRDRQR